MPLLEHQTVLGRCLQVPGADASTTLPADTVQGLKIDREELAQLLDLVHSSGFRFTQHVQHSWCVGRTAAAAQLTLSLLPVEGRQQLVEHWVEAGGGRALDPASEAEGFLEFVAHHLTDPSHPLTVCRMEQAAYRASEAALRFSPPDLSLLDHTKVMLRAGKGAALVRFFAEPQRLFDAIAAKGPLPPLSDLHFPVLFAPGLPKLYRAANYDEEAIWKKLVGLTAVRVLSRDRHARHAIDELFSVGAAELALDKDSGGPPISGRMRRCSAVLELSCNAPAPTVECPQPQGAVGARADRTANLRTELSHSHACSHWRSLCLPGR